MQGWPERAPFDRLIATCGVLRIPDAWCAQVRAGGVIVANLGLGIGRLTVAEDRSATGRFLPIPAAFMTARPTTDEDRAPAGASSVDLARATGRTREITPPADLTDRVPQFLAALVQPDVEQLLLGDVRYLAHQPTGSWARITPGPNDTARLEYDGPRDLWAELEPVLTGWAQLGGPAMEEYELHVTRDGDHLLRLGPRTWPLQVSSL